VSDSLDGTTDPIAVLHVDDDPDFVELAAEFLRAEGGGFTVRTETDVEAAIHRLDEEVIDCVVSDYEMPGLDGIAFLETVREHHPEIPFILFTGKGSEEVASEAISAGVTDYLQKEPGSSQFAVLANLIENVVAKRRAEAELQQVYDRMAFALDTTDAVVFEYDVETGTEVRHGPFERLYGVADHEVADLSSFYDRAVHPDDRATIEARQADVIDGVADSVELEYRTHPENGPVRWVRIAMARVPGEGDHDAASIIGLASDVTSQKEREQALRDSEERYRRLVETAPTPIFIYSTDSELVYANDAAVDFLGAENRSELLGSTVGDFTHPDSRPLVESRLQRLIEDREAVPPVEEKLLGVDGEEKHAILAAAPVVFEGEPAIQTVATDITAVKEREAELERQIERLDAFASIVSHDLRNPLSVARGRLELAREEVDNEDLEPASVALDRMSELIDDLLALARYGDAVQSLEPVALAEASEACWQTVSTDRATLEIETAAVVRADRGRLRQLLENLVRNAIDHAGPTVTVRIGDLEDGFYVEDDGPGIPEGRREQVFEHGHSTAPDGNGFGLTIVEQIADAHEWTVRATEGAAGGARIEVAGVEIVD
jgi:PAS domain S-box-containing protein